MPDIVTAKFDRAHKLHVLSWLPPWRSPRPLWDFARVAGARGKARLRQPLLVQCVFLPSFGLSVGTGCCRWDLALGQVSPHLLAHPAAGAVTEDSQRGTARQTVRSSAIPRLGVMGSEAYVLAIDEGTTSTRAILFDPAPA
jgi:hypothetical protein